MTYNPGVYRISRRDLLKAAAVGAGAFAFPYVLSSRQAQAYEPGQGVHPSISPLRVVGIHDDAMTSEVRPRTNWQDQEKLVRVETVQTNLDRLACALAEEKGESAAWRKIFLPPPGKAWSDVTVAIKTNNIAQQHTRSAVMAKLCHVLTDVLGVKGVNIHIYDAKHGGNLAQASPFSGLPEGVRIENAWQGITTQAPVAGPWKGGTGTAACLGSLARGEVDILVNMALCKGHGANVGGFTMTCKNHFGTFEPGPGHAGGATDYLLCINKSPAILGEQDANGRVLFPRQQLCIVDALWASKGGPDGLPEVQPNRLFMGVFGPVVDYQVATKFRAGTMQWPINTEVAERFLSEYGFTADQLPDGGRIVEAADFAP